LNFSRKISQHIAARAASKQSGFAFVPEGLHLDRSFTATVAIEVRPWRSEGISTKGSASCSVLVKKFELFTGDFTAHHHACRSKAEPLCLRSGRVAPRSRFTRM